MEKFQGFKGHILRMLLDHSLSRHQAQEIYDKINGGSFSRQDATDVRNGTYLFAHKLPTRYLETARQFHHRFSSIYRATFNGFVNGTDEWSPLPMKNHSLVNEATAALLGHNRLVLVDPRLFWHVGLKAICNFARVDYDHGLDFVTEQSHPYRSVHLPRWMLCHAGDRYMGIAPLKHREHMENVESSLTAFEGICLYVCEPDVLDDGRRIDLPGSRLADDPNCIATLRRNGDRVLLTYRDGRRLSSSTRSGTAAQLEVI